MGVFSHITIDKLNFHQSCLHLIYSHTVHFILNPSCEYFSAHIQCSYVSIMVIVVSNYGFFSTTYTIQTCQSYYLVAPVFKGLSYRCSPTMTLLTAL
jgi:hypothetical protein